jgi:peroxiredoxin Q/BCP
MIDPGGPAPDFTLSDQDGEPVSLSSLRGRWVALYFYPKADTPGCTKQACGIRDAYDEFRSRGAEVFGVSRDDAESHQAFKEKFGLPFPLLVDSDRTLGDAFGVADFEMLPDSYKRSTVVIGADGTVAKVIEDVDPATHADDVLTVL